MQRLSSEEWYTLWVMVDYCHPVYKHDHLIYVCTTYAHVACKWWFTHTHTRTPQCARLNADEWRRGEVGRTAGRKVGGLVSHPELRGKLAVSVRSQRLQYSSACMIGVRSVTWCGIVCIESVLYHRWGSLSNKSITICAWCVWWCERKKHPKFDVVLIQMGDTVRSLYVCTVRVWSTFPIISMLSSETSTLHLPTIPYTIVVHTFTYTYKCAYHAYSVVFSVHMAIGWWVWGCIYPISAVPLLCADS